MMLILWKHKSLTKKINLFEVTYLENQIGFNQKIRFLDLEIGLG